MIDRSTLEPAERDALADVNLEVLISSYMAELTKHMHLIWVKTSTKQTFDLKDKSD